MFLTLKCKYCEQDQCIYCPIGKIVIKDEGCTRQVSEEIAAQYQHYMQEVIPF